MLPFWKTTGLGSFSCPKAGDVHRCSILRVFGSMVTQDTQDFWVFYKFSSRYKHTAVCLSEVNEYLQAGMNATFLATSASKY